VKPVPSCTFAICTGSSQKPASIAARTGRTSGVTDHPEDGTRRRASSARLFRDRSTPGAWCGHFGEPGSPDWIGLGLDAEGQGASGSTRVGSARERGCADLRNVGLVCAYREQLGWAAQAHDAGVKAVAFAARIGGYPKRSPSRSGRHSMILFRLGKLDEAEVALAEAAAVPDQSRFLSLNILTATVRHQPRPR